MDLWATRFSHLSSSWWYPDSKVATTIITPVFLKFVFKDNHEEHVEDELMKSVEGFSQYEQELQELSRKEK